MCLQEYLFIYVSREIDRFIVYIRVYIDIGGFIDLVFIENFIQIGKY